MLKSARRSKLGRVLYVDDSPLARAAAARLIDARGFEPVVAASAAEVLNIDCKSLVCALLDLEVGTDCGIAIGRSLRETAPDVPVGFLTAAQSESLLAEARKVGPVFCKATETDLALGWLESHYEDQLRVAAS